MNLNEFTGITLSIGKYQKLKYQYWTYGKSGIGAFYDGLTTNTTVMVIMAFFLF